jgi:cytochrome b pre-mRNA-processing protein 3
MDRAADIIPISSRLGRRAPMPAAEPIRSTPEPSKRSWWALVLVIPGLILVAAVAISRAELVKSVRTLPPADRSALYHRTLTDVETTCTAPEARDGALRDHCLRQAEFLTLFPDCDARCQQLAASVLPHARR